MKSYLVLVHSGTKVKLDKSKFAQVRQFTSKFSKNLKCQKCSIPNLKSLINFYKNRHEHERRDGFTDVPNFNSISQAVYEL